MNHIKREVGLIFISAFVGALFSTAWQQLLLSPTSIQNWIGFTVFVVVLLIVITALLGIVLKKKIKS